MATSKEPSKVPGMEVLTRLATVNLHQTSAGFKGNKYAVLTEGELLFNMKEAGHGFTFLSKGHVRGFHMDGVDNTGQHVFSIRRPSVFMSDKVELYMNNALVSIVRSKPTFITPVFNINDARDVPILRVKGSFAENSFQLQATNKTHIGSITKQFRGLMEEMFSYKDNYTIIFPADLDVRFKLAVISTCIFIDYRYHES